MNIKKSYDDKRIIQNKIKDIIMVINMEKTCENCINFLKKEDYKYYAHCLYYNFPIRKNEVESFKNCENWNNLRD